MSLERIQKDFWRAVRFDPTPADALAHFVGDHRMSAADRMAIYRNMYWFRQIEALGETFPRLRDSLGAERFTKLACRYLRKHPSEHPTLEHIGHALPAFVAEEVPGHAGLCRLEWARLEALLSTDPVAIATAAQVDPESFGDARLAFVPSLDVVEVDRRAVAAYDDDTEWLDDGGADEPITVAVWRRRFRAQHHVLSKEEAYALDRARRGERVATVLASFDDDDDGIARAFEMILGWLTRHWIQSLELPPTS